MRTSLYSILCIGIRLAAVLLFVDAVLALPSGYSALTSNAWGSADPRWLVGIWTGVLLLALLLWVYPGVLARLAAGKASQQVFESPIDAGDLQYIAFSVVGLWILLAGVIGGSLLAVRALFIDHILRADSGAIAADARAQVLMELLHHVLRIVLGSVLMLRARGVVNILRRTRSAGIPAAENVVDEEKA